MRRIILTHGLVAGGVIIASFFLTLMLMGTEDTSASSAWIGYLTMMIALSVIFLGIKRYRDRELGGVIRFGPALLMGIGISLVAGAVYVAAWEVYLAITDHAFIHDYARSVLEAKQAEGLSGAALTAEVEKMDQMKVRYANPVFRLPMTFLEIFPVGLLISLISAALLRKSQFMPQS